MVPALTGTGSKPPAASTVLHSCGSFAIVRELRGLLAVAGDCMACSLSRARQIQLEFAAPTVRALRSSVKESLAGQAGFGQLCLSQTLSRRPWRTKIF